MSYTKKQKDYIIGLRAEGHSWRKVELLYNAEYGENKTHDTLRMAIKGKQTSTTRPSTTKKQAIAMPLLKLDLGNKYIRSLAKKITFIDIETSLIDARVFRTGQQQVNASQMINQTRILTVAGGSLYDLIQKGEGGMWSCSNHRSATFRKDPLDDAEILATVWEVLDKSEILVAHNAVFDKGWLYGRFLELGWKLPSRSYLFCTYRNLTPFNLTSKKLDELSQTLVDGKKIPTNMDLWMRCSEGEKLAFQEMENYNLGDVYNTLFKVFMRTAYYNPLKAVDFADPASGVPNCKVDGSKLKEVGVYNNRRNGLSYTLYLNTRANIEYIDRYNTRSKRAGEGFVRPHV
jgi:hypothetical protein